MTTMTMTEWEAHQIAARANRIELHGRSDWYVSTDKYGDPIIVDSDSNWLSSEDLGVLTKSIAG
jgi:hypothetical protein